MKKTLLFGLLSATVPFLAGCGSVVGALVPPQTITNPAGLTGATLAPSSALVIESVSGTIGYNTETTNSSFDDFKFPDNIPFGIRPHGVAFNTSFASAVVSGTCAAPDTVKVTIKRVDIVVKDAVATATVTQTPNLTLTLTKSSQGIGTASYTVAGNSLVLSADTGTSNSIITVLTTGGKNNASLSAAISADQNSLASCTLSFKLGETTATLSNFS
ncbi:hypothetical protein Q0M94_10270 [Deinococcus radiomollis]|uniref:hypothetical protein n=1 Tax=Deinococcus radiomollis TaxID=468916 RepID=UPI00389220F9